MSSKNSNNNSKYAKNITELCNKLGVSRDAYYNYKNHPDIPSKRASGYDVEGWRKVLEDNGAYIESDRAKLNSNNKKKTTTKSTKKNTKTYAELKNELTLKDIELRQLKIDKEKGKLVSREEANLALIGLTQLYKAQLESLPKVVASKLKDIKLESKLKKEIDRILEDTISQVRSL